MANKAKSAAAEPTRPAYDKTNTCSVNVVTSKKDETKKYSLFVCNIDGLELTGILNSEKGKLTGGLKRDKAHKEYVANVSISPVNSTNIDAPQFRGKIETKKGNIFEIALWEQFGANYHFWSGKVQKEGEGMKEDDGSNPFIKNFAAGEQQRAAQKANSAPVTNEDDDLPF